ncbi:MAG: hypothetical protein LBE56_09100 [Tannerella sp.]|jgi:hypothetical protein|nr:hypothetical protein [Tannerella sp.]
MMTNKERLEMLIEQIKRLATMSEEILEREIYPVSFFSQAYDIANKIQEDLHQMEVVQIELFEQQMRAHQAQIQSIPQSGFLTGKHTGRIEKAETAEKVNASGQAENAGQGSEVGRAEIDTQSNIVGRAEIDEQVCAATGQAEIVGQGNTVGQVDTAGKTEIDKQLNAAGPWSAVGHDVSDNEEQYVEKESQLVSGSNPPLSEPPPVPVREEKKSTVHFLTQEKKLADLQKFLTLNDRFLYTRELFAGNNTLFNQTISALNQEISYEDSIEYLKRNFTWNFKDEYVIEFMGIIKRRFS